MCLRVHWRYLTVSEFCFYFLFLNLQYEVLFLNCLGVVSVVSDLTLLISPPYEEALRGSKDGCRHLNGEERGYHSNLLLK